MPSIVILGDEGTGKTELAKSLCQEKYIFSEKHEPTINPNYLIFNKKNIKLELWDTQGAPKYENLLQLYLNKDLFIITYDPTNKSSFDNIEKYYNTIIKKNANAIIILVKTKNDILDQVVTDNEARKIKKQLAINAFLKTSAKENTGIEELSKELIKERNKLTTQPAISKESQKKYSFNIKNKIPLILFIAGIIASILVAYFFGPIFAIIPLLSGTAAKYIGDTLLKPKKDYHDFRININDDNSQNIKLNIKKEIQSEQKEEEKEKIKEEQEQEEKQEEEQEEFFTPRSSSDSPKKK